MKKYFGIPEMGGNDNGGPVFVQEDSGVQCGLQKRLDLRNHSPTGFAWNYIGSGPAQLALAILADAHNDQIAQLNYHQYMRDVIAKLPCGRWEILEVGVFGWLYDNTDAFEGKGNSNDNLETLQLQWEPSGDLLAKFEANGAIHRVKEGLTIGQPNNEYCLYRYFQIGHEWQISVDIQNASIDEILAYMCDIINKKGAG